MTKMVTKVMAVTLRGIWSSLPAYFSILIIVLNGVEGHGRLIEPPSRSSMWRYGFSTTPNYDDHELFCGGFDVQHHKNGGKCGVCGDPWDGPRPNEAGGAYAQGIIVRKYIQNSIINIKVQLTANHFGHFEFRICPNNNPEKVVSQECLDQHLLLQSNGEGPRFYPGEGTKIFETNYFLPKNMTCTQCVLQWRYVAANSWGGPCPDGKPEGLGCGPQVEFRACSDIAIYDEVGETTAEIEETNTTEHNESDASSKSNDVVEAEVKEETIEIAIYDEADEIAAEAPVEVIEKANAIADGEIDTNSRSYSDAEPEVKEKKISIEINEGNINVEIVKPDENKPLAETKVQMDKVQHASALPSSILPFIMPLIALIIIAVGFCSLLGWFYRKGIRQFFTKRKTSSTNSFFVPNADKKYAESLHRHVTPDIISEPVHITITGLDV